MEDSPAMSEVYVPWVWYGGIFLVSRPLITGNEVKISHPHVWSNAQGAQNDDTHNGGAHKGVWSFAPARRAPFPSITRGLE